MERDWPRQGRVECSVAAQTTRAYHGPTGQHVRLPLSAGRHPRAKLIPQSALPRGLPYLTSGSKKPPELEPTPKQAPWRLAERPVQVVQLSHEDGQRVPARLRAPSGAVPAPWPRTWRMLGPTSFPLGGRGESRYWPARSGQERHGRFWGLVTPSSGGVRARHAFSSPRSRRRP
jgi:hypothetical protein